jgi:NAD(P)-dependent dehydrogenase (short-subunit alcohol dehydrogenase family)
MQARSKAALVSGGASGLGLAAVRALLAEGARVVILDLPSSAGAEIAKELGPDVEFVAGDVTDPEAVGTAVQRADDAYGGLRILVHTAGVGGPLRLVDRDGNPGSLETFERLIRINLIGTFNVLRFAAASMARREPVDSERGVCVLTSSTAAYDGRIGQVHYAASKNGVVGMTLPAAREADPGLYDRARHLRHSAARPAAGRYRGRPGRRGTAPEPPGAAGRVRRPGIAHRREPDAQR